MNGKFFIFHLILMLVVVLGSPGLASAQLNDPCGCNAGLGTRIVGSEVSRQYKLSFLKQIDERQYNEIRKNGGSSVDIVELAKISMNWSDFQKRRSARLSTENYIWNEEQAQSFLLSEPKTDDWVTCKLACIRGQQGFICDATDVSKSLVTISCSWRPEGAQVNRSVKVTRNAKLIPKDDMLPSDIIEPNTLRSWQFSRSPSEDLVLVMTLVPGPSTPAIKIAAIPPPLPPGTPVPVPLGYCVGKKGQEGVHLWGPLGEMCNGFPGWGPYLTTGTPTPPKLCSCVGHGGFEGVRLWGPQGAPCGGITAWGIYSEECVSHHDLVLCGCLGHGKVLAGHLLWGPKGAKCGGMPDKSPWGKYSQYCVAPK